MRLVWVLLVSRFIQSGFATITFSHFNLDVRETCGNFFLSFPFLPFLKLLIHGK
jgi:hypothetical protein